MHQAVHVLLAVHADVRDAVKHGLDTRFAFLVLRVFLVWFGFLGLVWFILFFFGFFGVFSIFDKSF